MKSGKPNDLEKPGEQIHEGYYGWVRTIFSYEKYNSKLISLQNYVNVIQYI